MIVKDIDFQWEEKYSIFHAEKFLKTLSKDYGWIAGLKDDKTYFLLSYVIFKKLGIKIARFPDSELYFGNDEEFYQNNIQEFLEMGVQHLKKRHKVDLIMQPTTNSIFKAYPKKAIAADYGTYYLDLQKNEDDLWKGLHSKHRNSVRKGKKNGVTIKTGKQYVVLAHELITETFKRSKKDFMNLGGFKKLVSSLGKNIEIFIAFDKNKNVQGCAVIPYSNYCAYYSHGGSVYRPVSGAMNYMQWFMINYFKNKEVRYYDFVGARIDPPKGSKREGIQKFKKRFGPEFKQGYLWKYPLTPWKYYVFSNLYKLLKSKEGDVIDQES